MAMSIAHRATGMVIFFGTILVVWWLAAAADGPDAFAVAQSFFGSWLGILILIGLTFSLIHHSVGGIKHLFQDLGYGFSQQARFLWAQGTLAASVLLTILVWVAVWVTG